MAVTRTSPRSDLARVEAATPNKGEDSMAVLATRLAEEGMALAAVELRRLGVEVGQRRRHAVRAVVAGIVAAGFAAAATAMLAVAVLLYLGRLWQDYAAGALAAGALLLVMASIGGRIVVSAMRRLVRIDAAPDRDGHALDKGDPRDGA